MHRIRIVPMPRLEFSADRRLPRSPGWRLLVPASVLVVAVAASAASAGEPDASLRDTMHRVLAGLEKVLPASVDRSRPMTKVERERFAKDIDALLEQADAVDRHAALHDRGFRYLSTSLVTDLAEVRRSLERGDDESARYYLVQATSNCVACHSRLPSDESAQLGKRLYDRVAADAESAHERAQLLVATRQFDRAVAEWEKLFADPTFPAAQFDVGGYLLDYLTVQVRVRGDLVSPQAVLRKLALRADTPLYLHRLLEHWVNELSRLAAVPEPAPDERVVRARELIFDRSHEGDLPAARGRLIADLVASGWLMQYVDGADEDDPSLGEAFYLLGLVEARGVDGYWLPLTEAHLEAAIRVDPAGPFAERAYLLLEEYIVTGYGGAVEPYLPPEQQERLFALRTLIRHAKQQAAQEE